MTRSENRPPSRSREESSLLAAAAAALRTSFPSASAMARTGETPRGRPPPPPAARSASVARSRLPLVRAKCHQRCPPRAVLRRRARLPRGVVDPATIRRTRDRRRREAPTPPRLASPSYGERSAGVAPFGNRGEMTGRGRGWAGGVTRPPRTRGGRGRRTRGDGGGGGSRSRDGGRRESLLLLASLLLRALGLDLADEVLHALHGLLGLGFSPALLHGASQLELRAVVRARGRRRGRAGGVAIGPRAGPGGARGVRIRAGSLIAASSALVESEGCLRADERHADRGGTGDAVSAQVTRRDARAWGQTPNVLDAPRAPRTTRRFL